MSASLAFVFPSRRVARGRGGFVSSEFVRGCLDFGDGGRGVRARAIRGSGLGRTAGGC